MHVSKIIFLGLVSAVLLSCSADKVIIDDSNPAEGRLLAFPPAFYESVVHVDGQIIAFTYDNRKSSVERVSYVYENDPDLHAFNPQRIVQCDKFIGYIVKGNLPDGRIGFLGCGESVGSNWSMFALDWRSGEVEQLVKGPLVSGYSPKDFTWNPQMTRGVQEMVDGAQGTINWISPEGVSPMDIEIEDQGLKWNLKDYYENHYSFEKGTGFVLSPAWSPDGKTIAFLVSTYGMREKPRLRANIRYEIYFMDPIELKPVQAVRGIVNAYRLRWSPDSKHLLFGGCLESKCGLWIYNLERETIVLVTEGEFFNSIWKTNNEIVAIKNTNGYLKEAEIWEYSVDELLKQQRGSGDLFYNCIGLTAQQ